MAPSKGTDYIRNRTHLITETILPGKMWMFSLVQDDDDVTWLDPWLLVPLSMEHDLLSISHACGRYEQVMYVQHLVFRLHLYKLFLYTLTFVDVDLQNLLLAHDLSTATCFAAVLVVDPLSLALTAMAHCGHLLDHTWY